MRTCKVRPSFWVKLAVTRRCTDKDLTQAGPRFMDVVRFQALADSLDELIGPYRDEQMAIGAVLPRMEDRAQPQFALQATED